MKPLIAITMGDPLGIGPEILLKAFSHSEFIKKAHPFVLGDHAFLTNLQARLVKKRKVKKIPLLRLSKDHSLPFSIKTKNSIPVIDFGNVPSHKMEKSIPTAWSGKSSGEYIEYAIQKAVAKGFHAVVTLPINKVSFRLGGWGKKYIGHTEMFGDLTKTKKYALLLVHNQFRALHVTSHIPFRDISTALTKKRIIDVIQLAHSGLIQMGITSPKIGVSGLNPHAGEAGVLGREELDVIAPAVRDSRRQRISVEGPLSPDILWPAVYNKNYDIGIAMYHDQGQIPFKLLSFRQKSRTAKEVAGVNVTLGLPIIRTSVAHGTAFDIAGKGVASTSSFLEAYFLAVKMAKLKK